MNQQTHIGVVADIIPADSPLMSGQGPYSACGGDFKRLFGALYEYSKGFDFLVGNFEAVLVEKIDKMSPATSAMKAPLSVLKVLKQCGFKFISIANNHTMEYGKEAFFWMCEQFEQSGIQTFGHKDTPFCSVNHQGLTIGLFAFSTVPAMYGCQPEYFFVNPTSQVETDSLLKCLKEAKTACDRLLVFPHWGNEFMPRPAPWQVELARHMTLCGADVILGAHPHVVQPACLINKKPVFFSMGNLLSDYFQERFKRNVVVEIHTDKNDLEVSGRFFSCDSDFVIFNTEAILPGFEALNETETAEHYAAEANEIRKEVRSELIWHLLKHPQRWIFNMGLWAWIFSRACFLTWNARQIRRNPNAVYSGPIH